jgi:gamma-carbonic anhydrase
VFTMTQSKTTRLEEQFGRFLCKGPTLGQGVFIAPGAVVVGDVTLGDGSSVWYNATLRGDINRIEVGHHTNIQDNVVVHLADEIPCIIGSYVTVGHSAVLHACTIGEGVLVGMGAIVLDAVSVGAYSLIGAGALVTQGKQIPPGSLVLGAPAKVVRSLCAEERDRLRASAEKYAEAACYYLACGIRAAGSSPR